MPLSPSMGSGTYVKDFVKSKNPKFKGKSKKKRIDMALGAYYAAKQDKAKVTNDNPYNSGNRKYSYTQYRSK
jgi:hypothetical protein